jgi:hypothetical protein
MEHRVSEQIVSVPDFFRGVLCLISHLPPNPWRIWNFNLLTLLSFFLARSGTSTAFPTYVGSFETRKGVRHATKSTSLKSGALSFFTLMIEFRCALRNLLWKRRNTVFLTHQFIATCSVILTLGSTAAVSEARHHQDVSSVTVSAPARDGEIVKISDLHPFTHIAYIPVEADRSSIKIESIKAVKVATKQRSVNPGDCNELWAEPGGSRYCPLIMEESPVPAFRVTYSYRGPSTASDEIGRSTYFTFDVYFRPDEISPGVLRALSSGKIHRSAAAEFFQLTTTRDSIQQDVVDQANSTFCDGTYVDGSWIHTNPRCEDSITYREVVSASPYITVNIDPVPHSFETTVAGIGPRQK